MSNESSKMDSGSPGAQTKPLVAAKVGAVLLALGALGFFVVEAQQSANPSDAPDRDASAQNEADSESDPEYLMGTKSMGPIKVIDTSDDREAKPKTPVFLPTSKSAPPELLRHLTDEKTTKRPPYLPSSKSGRVLPPQPPVDDDSMSEAAN